MNNGLGGSIPYVELLIIEVSSSTYTTSFYVEKLRFEAGYRINNTYIGKWLDSTGNKTPLYCYAFIQNDNYQLYNLNGCAGYVVYVSA